LEADASGVRTRRTRTRMIVSTNNPSLAHFKLGWGDFRDDFPLFLKSFVFPVNLTCLHTFPLLSLLRLYALLDGAKWLRELRRGEFSERKRLTTPADRYVNPTYATRYDAYPYSRHASSRAPKKQERVCRVQKTTYQGMTLFSCSLSLNPAQTTPPIHSSHGIPPGLRPAC
jgi:hypothetical protein